MDSFTRRASDDDRSSANPSTVPKRTVADHGAIGNLSTMALVALDGAIDFLCWPNFDSPSIFAALLDPDVGGSFQLAPVIDNARVIQTYIPDSNVLTTRWLGDAASAEVMDLMTGPVKSARGASRLIRRVRVSRGNARFNLRCDPRPDYARARPLITVGNHEVTFKCERTTQEGYLWSCSSRCTISATVSAGRPPVSTVIECSSGVGSCKIANWLSSSATGMKCSCLFSIC